MQPRIYTYKITFEEIPYWYWGVHKEKRYNDNYLGSPYTHKWVWNFYTPYIQMLEIFPYTSEGWIEACKVEQRIIIPDLNKPFCLNERAGSVRSLEVIRRCAKAGGDKIYKNKIGIHARTVEQMSIDSKKGNKKPGGLKTKENKLGIFGRSKAEIKIDSQKGAASTNLQKWKSTVDGFISTAGGVAMHNKVNNWDPKAKIKLV